MPTLEQILKRKLSRLETIPDEFISGIDKVEKEFLIKAIERISKLQKIDGQFVFNDENIKILASLELDLKTDLLKSGYSDLVKTFIGEFSIQAAITNDYFAKAFTEVSKSAITEAAALNLQLIKQDAAKQLLGKPVDVKFINAITNTVNDAVISNSSFTDTLQSLQTLVVGDAEVDSKIKQYAKQVAHDLFAVGDRQYTTAVSDEIDAQWFLWGGDVIPTSRQRCIENHNKYFHKKELEKQGEQTWDGQMEGTNSKTIFAYAGGYGCRHSIMPVSVFAVPQDVIQRNINNGNYKPNDRN